jgi:hypothetical protein
MAPRPRSLHVAQTASAVAEKNTAGDSAQSVVLDVTLAERIHSAMEHGRSGILPNPCGCQ